MNCKNYKTRTKKGIKYNYCTLLKKEITFEECKHCTNKEYKQYKKLKSRTYKQSKKEKNRISIIYQDLTKCCYCGSKREIEINEIFEGAYRTSSIKYGMVCPFCKDCHKRFHNDYKFNLFYKVMFEKEYLKTHTLDEFIEIFKQDYIYLSKKKN